MNEIDNIKKEISTINKQISRVNTFYALITAHTLDRAILESHLAKKTTLQEAKTTSAFINFLWKAETTPYEFMRPIDETSNKAIDHFNSYNLFLQRWPNEKRVLESFCKWYVNTGWDASNLKCNLNYILYSGIAIQDYTAGNISKQELDKCIESVAEAGKRFFSFKPQSILRAFTQASHKLSEIEDKIYLRTLFEYGNEND